MRFLIMFFPLFLFAGKVLVVPDYEGYVTTMFPQNVTRSNYGNYGVWGKLKVHFQERGEVISGASLRKYLEHPETIASQLEEEGVDRIVLINIPNYIGYEQLKWFPKEKMVLMMYEPPTVIRRLYDPKLYQFFGKVLTWQDDLIDGKGVVKMHYPVHVSMKKSLVPFNKRHLICSISRNKTSTYPDEIYSERVRAIEFFEGHSNFHLYGYGWESAGYSNYRGSIADKYATLRNYRFSICYENTRDIQGYITEKIFDCFHVGCIPIYLGASNITDYIPKECFIDKRDFSTYDALLEYIENMPESQFNKYIAAINNYLRSPKSSRFTEEEFISNFIANVN